MQQKTTPSLQEECNKDHNLPARRMQQNIKWHEQTVNKEDNHLSNTPTQG
jgi:hypothetical protein